MTQWHGRSSAVWYHHGASYAQLTAKAAADHTQVADSTSSRGGPAAGTPSQLPPRGVGSFTAEQSWSLGTVGRQGQLTNPGFQQATESKSQYTPPPNDYQRRAAIRTGARNNFPVPNYPHDFKTTKQTEYPGDPRHLPGYERSQPCQPVPSPHLLPVDCTPPIFTTRAQADYTGDGAAAAAARAHRGAGHPATAKPGYNIITGGGTLSNNAFEQWDGRDYRRHR